MSHIPGCLTFVKFDSSVHRSLLITFIFIILFADHHDESGSFEDPYITKTIESVGSCCTLIAEKVYNKSESLFAEFPIADLLLSTILLDTVNLKLGIGRTTEKDIEFAEELEQYASCPMQELFDVAQKGTAHSFS